MKNAQTAAGRLGLSTLTYDMRAHGTDATGQRACINWEGVAGGNGLLRWATQDRSSSPAAVGRRPPPCIGWLVRSLCLRLLRSYGGRLTIASVDTENARRTEGFLL